MKKTFSFILLTLFLMFFSFVIFPVKVFAIDLIYAEDWFNHISQFEFGFAYGEIADNGDIRIMDEPGHEYEGFWIDYGRDFADWFDPELELESLADDDDVVWYLENNFEDFDGYLYWNFEQGYWQIEYYEASELDYYKQRVEDLENEIGLLEDEIQDLENEIGLLEDEIQDLENEKGLLEDEIQDLENEIQQLEDEISLLENENSLLNDEIQRLEDEISLLENEIQQLEEALDFEYERGFDEGYNVGYNEGLLVENNNITKWFVPLVVVIIVVGIIEPIIILKRRG